MTTSDDHELVIDLFRQRPELLPMLLAESLGVEIPAHAAITVEPSDFSEVKTTTYHADLALGLRDAAGSPVMAIVGEYQRQWDDKKLSSWPLYWSSMHAQLRCRTCLAVVTFDAGVERRAREPIGTLLPPTAPLVIGPSRIPRARSDAEARRQPELALLSARAHGNEPGAVDVLRRAMLAIGSMPPERGRLYYDWLVTYLGHEARKVLEELMAPEGINFVGDFARKCLAEGEARGRVEGEARGRAEAVLTVLDARGVQVDEASRARILACVDRETLDRWIARAVSAASVAEVLAE